MESSFEVKRSTRTITVQPDETVLTALPYGPNNSLLDFLKGEPRVLGAIQILLALIIVSIGTIFAFNFFRYSQRFPLVFFTGYPFWGALIFIIAGYVTGFNKKEECLGKGVMAMNVISSLAAVAGITLTIISFQYQHQYCKVPSIEGICVIGRILFNGILSVLLILSLVELSISVTIASFRSKCWTKSNEIVFFLPLDVAHKSELSIHEENAVIQMDLQEESNRNDLSTIIQPVFFGGYTFFKLRVSRNPLTFHHSWKRGSNNYYTSSSSGSDEQQKNIPLPSKYNEEEIELEPPYPILENMISGDSAYTEQINDEDLQFAIDHPPERQTQLLQAETLSLQVFPSHSVKNLKVLPPYDLPYDTLSLQALISEAPTHHITQSHDLISKDMPSQNTKSQDTTSQDTSSQDTPSQDMLSQSYDLISEDTPSQDTLPQNMPSQNMLSQVQVLPIQTMQFKNQTFHAAQALSEQHQEQQFLDLHLQNIQHEDQQFTHLSYQDIQTEVNLLTQEWKYETHKSRKSTKQHSFNQQHKAWQSSTKKFLELPTQDQQFPRKKSLDQHIKGWLYPKRHSIDKQVSDQQAEDQLIQGKQSLKQQSQSRLSEDQQSEEEKSPKRQSQQKQAKDLQAQDEKSPEQLSQHLQSQIQKYQDWQPLGQQSQDWESQGWRNKDCKAQECQFEMKRSLNWESQAWQTQDLLEKEFLKHKVLYKTQTLHAIPQNHLDQQSQDVVSPDSQYQDKNQPDLRSTGIPKENMQIVPIQRKDLKLVDMKSLCKTPSDPQSEDMKSDFPHSSCQSSVQDASSTYSSNVGSEQDVQDVQQNTSISSTLTSFYTKDQQQSEDSD
ncbi:membrane-spanning 4-domains subfamily A member 14 [Pteronotus mesoamericanus]|uniref:membrane-spanning 4-domains subfamily A member 14 n=1 Tax=Pteronotus mesoamericanus TaxID=1884717 RepID=UPI0023EC2F9C|nr:membrane-spanning 4-domains subfamily A member 14 [Pteronotus parnellii mesoamericanus]